MKRTLPAQGITLCEMCLTLLLLSISVGIFSKIHALHQQQNTCIHEMQLIPIYVDTFEFFVHQKQEDMLGDWFASQELHSKQRIFTRNIPYNVICQFIFKVSRAPIFSSKAFEVQIFSMRSKQKLFTYVKEGFNL
ncbi:MAG: hypothetical protein LBD69_01840 [Puniceicoccales bacterium]|jgi:hypothetical protein|nr:hypothetical protein [Puniceicoccales bacterium]